MSVSINVPLRGGLTAFGDARYDARERVVYVRMNDNEVRAVSITFAEDVEEVELASVTGLTASEPEAEGAAVTFTLTNATGSGSLDVVATLESGEVRRVSIALNTMSEGDRTWGN